MLYSLLSGLAEPAGALIGFFFLLPFLTPVLLAVLFAVVAGVMIYISFDELLPMAETYGKHHIALAGVLGGMLFIGAGLDGGKRETPVSKCNAFSYANTLQMRNIIPCAKLPPGIPFAESAV